MRVGDIKVMFGPSLHTLKKDVAAKGFQPQYAARIVDAAEAMHSRRVPVIFSLMHLAWLSRVEWQYLRAHVERRRHDYQTFSIRKRSGGDRIICAPGPMLRRVQAWVHENILLAPGAIETLNKASSAYAPKSSVLKNASAHAGAAWMIKVDIKDFFESISERQIYYVFRRLGYSALLSFELARLCTRTVPLKKYGEPALAFRYNMRRWYNEGPEIKGPPYKRRRRVGHLPQGAPTSAMLANYAVADLDARIAAIAKIHGASYTRYADDIVLTLADGDRQICSKIFGEVSQEITKAGYRLNSAKSRVVGPGGRKIVTGLVINDKVVRLPRTVKDDILLVIYHIKKHGLLGHMEKRRSKRPLGYLNHLVGRILYCHSIEPAFGRRAMTDLRAALEPCRDLLAMARELGLSPDDTAPFEGLHRLIFSER